MKRHLSVMMLAARSTMYKYLLLLLGMCAVEAGLFFIGMGQAAGQGLEWVVGRCGAPIACGAAFVALCAILGLSGAEVRGSRERYTLNRLRVGEKTVALWRALYYFICFLIFWGVQAYLMLLLCHIYTLKADPEFITEQTVFLACYRSKFLHSLMPLEDTGRWIRNLLLALGLGVTASGFQLSRRRDGRDFKYILLAAASVALFCSSMGSVAVDLAVSILSLALTGAVLYELFRRGRDEQTV